MNMILLRACEVGPDGLAELSDRRFHHIKSILKAEPGRKLRIGVLNGPAGEALVEEISESRVVLRCAWNNDERCKEVFRLALILAMPRPRVLRRLLPQLVALGAAEINIVGAARVEGSYFRSHLLREEEYMPLIEDGLAQSRRTSVPSVNVIKQLRPWLEERCAGEAWRGFLLCAAEPGPVSESWLEVRNCRGAVLAVGPEGGWLDDELEYVFACGFRRISLGPQPLRTETACVSAIGAMSVLRWLPSCLLRGR